MTVLASSPPAALRKRLRDVAAGRLPKSTETAASGDRIPVTDDKHPGRTS